MGVSSGTPTSTDIQVRHRMQQHNYSTTQHPDTATRHHLLYPHLSSTQLTWASQPLDVSARLHILGFLGRSTKLLRINHKLTGTNKTCVVAVESSLLLFNLWPQAPFPCSISAHLHFGTDLHFICIKILPKF